MKFLKNKFVLAVLLNSFNFILSDFIAIKDKKHFERALKKYKFVLVCVDKKEQQKNKKEQAKKLFDNSLVGILKNCAKTNDFKRYLANSFGFFYIVDTKKNIEFCNELASNFSSFNLLNKAHYCFLIKNSELYQKDSKLLILDSSIITETAILSFINSAFGEELKEEIAENKAKIAAREKERAARWNYYNSFYPFYSTPFYCGNNCYSACNRNPFCFSSKCYNNCAAQSNFGFFIGI